MSGSFFKAGSVQENMKMLSDKVIVIILFINFQLTERFKNFGHAFRFFDLHSSGKLSLADFSFGLDQLMVKFSRAQISELFKRVDVDGDG